MYDIVRRVKNEPSEPYQKVSQIFERFERNGLRETTRENKFRCTDVYRRREDNGGGLGGVPPPSKDI